MTFKPSELNDEVKERGFDGEAFRRLAFRIKYIQELAVRRNEVIANGNLANLSPEIMMTNGLIGDLTNVMGEILTLFQQEQGVAPPPNTRKVAETPGEPGCSS